MKNDIISDEVLESFKQSLSINERSSGTVEKYLRDVRNFADWLIDARFARIFWRISRGILA